MNWFTDYLFPRKQIVQFKGVLSEPNPIFTGVPTRKYSRAVIVLIHFNDVHKSLRCSKIITDADGSVILTSSKNLDAIQHNLSENINSLASWFRDNELKFSYALLQNIQHSTDTLNAEESIEQW